MTHLIQTIILAIVAGIIPAGVWLAFWLHEDAAHPEPRSLIFLSFFSGVATVPIALLLEQLVSVTLLGGADLANAYAQGALMTVIVIVAWALIEETLKLLAAYKAGLRKREADEPIDDLIYLISSALGFAAAENALFLVTPLLENDLIKTIVTGNMRFVGASLLHVVSSATIGIFLAYSFYKSKTKKITYTLLGLGAAVVLHSLFNFFIIKNVNNIFGVFLFVWTFVVILILMFEKVKKIRNINPLTKKI